MRLSHTIAMLGLCAVTAGCGPKPKATTSAKGSSDVVSGAIQNVRGAVQRTVTAHEMGNLRIFIENASLSSGRMPSVDEIRAAATMADPKLAQMLKDGSIVLTGAKERESVWAYEKDVTTKGGFVLSQNGVERLTAEEAALKLKN